ncbi:MAG: diguanylate cyclase domain-containing protein [Acidimicrobiales bacterium]
MTNAGSVDRGFQEALAAIGLALAGRSQSAAISVADWWEEEEVTPGPNRLSGSEELRPGIIRFATTATDAVAHYLITSEPTSDEKMQALSRSCRTPFDDRLSLADLTKLYLYWRDATVSAVKDAAEQLGSPSAVVEHAIDAVREGVDGSMVGMTRQFDLAYGELRAQLVDEQVRLGFLALHDPLTGLPNRALFFEQLTRALDDSNRQSSQVVVLYLDVDNFKLVNDMAGHSAGDQLLIAIATRLSQVVRPSDTAARLGGDEFVILCEGLRGGEDGATSLARRIGNALSTPLVVDGRTLTPSASIGVAVASPGDDPELVLSHADEAMYSAKQRGRARYEIYRAAEDLAR